MSDVKRREIANLMDRIERSTGTSVADRVHEQLAIFFRWYAERDDEFTSPLVRTMKRHRKGAGARPMTDDELRQFWFRQRRGRYRRFRWSPAPSHGHPPERDHQGGVVPRFPTTAFGPSLAVGTRPSENT